MIVDKEVNKDMYRVISIKLEEALKEDRRYLARRDNLSLHYVFDNGTLSQLIKNIPTTKEEMLRISGIKEVKYNKYGERLITTIKSIVSQYNIDKVYWRAFSKYKNTQDIGLEDILDCIDKDVDPFTNEKISGLSNSSKVFLKEYFKKLSLNQKEPDLFVCGTFINMMNDAKKERDKKVYIKKKDIVEIKDKVLVRDLNTNIEAWYTIFPVYIKYEPVFNFRGARNDLRYKQVEVCEADPSKNEIGENTPLARAILGKYINEEVTYKVEDINYKKQILSIKKKVIK